MRARVMLHAALRHSWSCCTLPSPFHAEEAGVVENIPLFLAACARHPYIHRCYREQCD